MSAEAHEPPPSDAIYSVAEVTRLTGASADQLRRWDRVGLITASRNPDGRTAYRFPDLIAVRTALALLDGGVTARQVRQAVEALRAWRPGLGQPLAAVRVISDHGRLLVRLDDALVDAASGQLCLALPVRSGQPARESAGSGEARVVPVTAARDSAPRDATGWIALGLARELADHDPDAIESCYQAALTLEPEHPGALLNLGNLRFGQGELAEAARLYRRVTEAAPEFAEAWYNLANVHDELAQTEQAVEAYHAALSLAPDFADAHFNLALAWEKLGRRLQARPHWIRFLALDPQNASAPIARRFLVDDRDLDD